MGRRWVRQKVIQECCIFCAIELFLYHRIHPTDYDWGPIPAQFLAMMSNEDAGLHRKKQASDEPVATAHAYAMKQRNRHYRLPSRGHSVEESEQQASKGKSSKNKFEQLTAKAAKMGTDGWLSEADSEAKWLGMWTEMRSFPTIISTFLRHIPQTLQSIRLQRRNMGQRCGCTLSWKMWKSSLPGV